MVSQANYGNSSYVTQTLKLAVNAYEQRTFGRDAVPSTGMAVSSPAQACR